MVWNGGKLGDCAASVRKADAPWLVLWRDEVKVWDSHTSRHEASLFLAQAGGAAPCFEQLYEIYPT